MEEIKYTSDFYSTAGVSYTIQIIDMDGGASNPLEFTCSNVSLKYKGDEEDRFTPIIESEFSFNFLVENLTHETFCKAVALDTENRYTVKILTGIDVVWYGYINSGNIEISDESYPFEYNLTATDGISLMKSKPLGQPASTSMTIREAIWFCLNDDTVILSDGLNSYIGWQSNIQAASTDAIDQTLFDMRVFSQAKDGQGGDNWGQYTKYEALEYIVSRFNSRIFRSDKLYLIGVNYYKETTLNGSWFDSSGVFQERVTLSPATAVRQLSGGSYSYLFPCYRVEQEALCVKRTNFLIYEYYNTPIMSEVLNTLPLVEGTEYIFSSTLGMIHDTYIWWTTPEMAVNMRFKYKVYFKNGSYSLGGSYNQPEWNANTSSYYIMEGSMVTMDRVSAWKEHTVRIEVPQMPDDGVFTLEIEPYGYRNETDSQSTVRTFPANFIFQNKVFGKYPTLMPEGDSKNINQKFSADVTDSKAKYSFTLHQQVLGGSIPSVGLSTLLVWDDPDYKIPTGWRDVAQKVSSTYIDIYQLALKDFLYDQKAPIDKYNGAVIGGGPNILNIHTFNSGDWVVMQGDYDFQMDEWSGTWFKIDKTTKTLTITDTDDLDNFNPVDSFEIVQSTEAVSAIARVANTGTLITTTTDVLSNTDTTVTVVAIQYAILNVSDKIVVEHPNGYDKIELTVSDTQSASATSISVNEVTGLPFDFPIGCTVRFYGDYFTRMVKHKQEGTIAGATVTSTQINGSNIKFNFSTGNVNLTGLPTSPTGLNIGDLYINGDLIAIKQ